MDTLNLAAGCPYAFASADVSSPENALPPITTPLTINGNGATLRKSGPVFRLLYIAGGGNLTLDNITVTGGTSTFGGGIYNNGGTLTVTNSTISDNLAFFSGGGIFNLGTLTVTDTILFGNNAEDGGGILSGGTLTVTNGEFSGNGADYGGGIYNNAGTLTVTNGEFSGNSADYGGGIWNDGTLIVTSNSTLSFNIGFNNGGGIHNSGTLIMTNTTLFRNGADYGGGIYNDGGALIVTKSTLARNDTGSSGGGIYNDGGGTVKVTNSTLAGNTAPGNGGGINNDGTLTATNSIFSGNDASNQGGGIRNIGTLTVTNSTLSGNSAGFGGGIFNGSGGTATVTNSVTWGNNSQIYNFGTITVTTSDVEGGFTGAGNLNLDPLFVGAVSHTSAPTTAGNYRLQRTSPALNTGNNAVLPLDTYDLDGDANTAEQIPHDRDGNPRVAGGTVDMGAYEIQPGELLANGSFEIDADLNKIPDGWTVKNPIGDKLMCKLGKPHTGLCAFQFKGGVPEKAQLSQTVNLSGVTLGAGDTLTLSAFFKGNDPTAKVKFMLRVTYAGNPTPEKSSVTVTHNAAYTQIALPVMSVTATVEQIKVTFKHKSTAGKVLVDDASLIHTPLGARSRSDTLLPPLAPSGFRGGN